MIPVEFDRLVDSLTNQKPTEAQVEQIEKIRSAAIVLGGVLLTTPPSRERSLSITKLEEAVMWAVKGVVLNPTPNEGF